MNEIETYWTDQHRIVCWFWVEKAISKAAGDLGVYPQIRPDLDKLDAEQFDLFRIQRIEEETKHDLAAFVNYVCEIAPTEDVKQYFHYGCTSSDIVDTAFSMVLCRVANRIFWQLSEIRNNYRGNDEHMFNLIDANIYRIQDLLKRASHDISYGKVSGVVGVYGQLSPDVEKKALSELGLKSTACTQVIPRDFHASYMSTISIAGLILLESAVQLQNRSLENIYRADTIMLNSNARTAMENVALWHQRDISHSSVERIIFPQSTKILSGMVFELDKALGPERS